MLTERERWNLDIKSISGKRTELGSDFEEWQTDADANENANYREIMARPSMS